MRYRDLSLIPLGEKMLLFATDSAGAIGSKPLDVVSTSNRNLGRYLAQVPFMEILATRAHPSYVFLPICNEMEPTAREILEGVRSIMQEAGMPTNLINGTTEENMPTQQTAATILVMAVVDGDFVFPKACAGEVIFAIGLPKIGQEVLEDQGEIVTLAHFMRLRALEEAGDILPVGSRGIAYEAAEMAKSHDLKLHFLLEDPFLYKSAGPATVALVSGKAEIKGKLESLGLPVQIIAELK